MSFCKLKPEIQKSTGETVPSRLYDEIINHARIPKNQARDIAIYFVESIKQGKINLPLSDQLETGEPSFETLLQHTNIAELLQYDTLEEDKKRLGVIDDSGQIVKYADTTRNYERLSDTVLTHNKKDDGTLLLLNYEEDAMTLSLVPKTNDNLTKAEQQKYHFELGRKLDSILRSNGIEITHLNEHDKALRAAGVTAFETYETTADNIIQLIRLAEGYTGQLHKPEEFCHWLIDVKKGDSFIERLLSASQSVELQEQVLGEEYEKYLERYQNNSQLMQYETAAHILKNELLTPSKVPSRVKKLMLKIKALLKQTFPRSLGALITETKEDLRGYSAIVASKVKNDPYYTAKQRLNFRVRKDLNAMAGPDGNTNQSVKVVTTTMETIKKMGNSINQAFLNQVGKSTTSTSTPEIPITENEEIKMLFVGLEDYLKAGMIDSLDASKAIKELMDIETKRLKLFMSARSSANRADFIRNQKSLLDSLKKSRELIGFDVYVSMMATRLNSLNDRLNKFDSLSTPQAKATLLTNINSYLSSYDKAAPIILTRLKELEKDSSLTKEDMELLKTLISKVTTLSGTKEDLHRQYRLNGLPLFADFLKPILGDAISVPIYGTMDKIVKTRDYLEHVTCDIGMFEMLLDSLSQTANPVLQALDMIMAEKHNNARLRAISFVRDKIFPLAKEFERLNSSDNRWMIEKDEKGNLTDYYISPIKHHKYQQERQAKKEEIEQKEGLSNMEKEDLYWQWVKAHTDKTGAPLAYNKDGSILYANEAYEALSDQQKKLLNEFLALKEILEQELPTSSVFTLSTIKIHKDFLERMSSSASAEDIVTGVKNTIQDRFIRRCDDMGYAVGATKGFNDETINVLPILYTKRKENESPEDMSLDIISNLSAYALMAFNYAELHTVASTINLGVDLLRSSTIGTQTGSTVLTDEEGEPVKKAFAESKTFKRLVQAVDHGLYGIAKADEGSFDLLGQKVDTRKVADNLNAFTALSSYAFNGLSALANVLNGGWMQQIESFAGQFITHKDLLKADAVYARDILPYLAERGMAIKNSKMELWVKHTNVLFDTERHLKNLHYDRNRITREGLDSIIYSLDRSGTHWLNVRTSLAVSNHDKLKHVDSKTGKTTEYSVYDAYDVVKSASGISQLQMKKGLQNKNGLTIITKEELRERAETLNRVNKTSMYNETSPTLIKGGEISEYTYINQFNKKVNELNQMMFGNYNAETAAMAQTYALGTLALMFRKYIKSSLKRRFGYKQYNYALDTTTEGYYQTLYRITKRFIQEFKAGATLSHLEDWEKSNMKRAGWDAGMVLALGLAITFVLEGSDDDEHEASWIKRTADYMVRRLYRELGSLTPSHLMWKEGTQIIKHPAAAVNTLESLSGLLALLNPYNYEFIAGEDALLQTGPFEDMSKAERGVLRLTPYKTIYRLMHPEESSRWYKQTTN